MRVWVTKYALTQGIYEREVRDCGDDMIADDSTHFTTYLHKGDWHTSKKDAILKADEMRKKKIESLKKKIKQLENMKFD